MRQLLDAVVYEKMQEYWWYVEAFCNRPGRKELMQTAGENRSIQV
jgi:hypothetical protein